MYAYCHPARRIRCAIRQLLLAAAAVFLCGSFVLADEARTWTDSTGKFTIVGKIASNDGKTVKIEKSDGKTVSIPIDKLSKTDQQYLASMSDANPFEEVEESPFQPEEPAMNNDDAAPAPAAGGAANGGQPREIRINYNGIRNVDFEPQNDDFGIEVTPLPEAKLRTKPFSVPPNFGFWDKLEGMKVSANGRVLLGYETEVKNAAGHIPIPVGANDKDTRVIHFTLADAVAGKVLSEAHFIGEGFRLLALHDDGVRFAVRSEKFGFGNAKTLEIWAFNGPKSIVRGFRLEPFGDADWDPRKDIQWAEFVGDRLLVGRDDRMMAINIADGRPQYQLPVGGKPAITPDKKHVVFWQEKHLAILDVATGKIICAMPFDCGRCPAMGIDPTGKHLVCLANNELTKFNLQNGEIETQFTIEMSMNQNGGIIVLDDRYILSPNGELCDMQNQVKAWNFSGAARIKNIGNTAIFYKSEGDKGNGAIMSQELPGAALSKHLDEVMSKPGFFCVEPGVKVRLDVDAITDQQKKQEILAALFKKLEANGNVVDPNGEVILKASVESKGPKEVNFWGGGKVTFQEYVSRLEFIYQGKTAWARSGTNIPGVLQYDRNEGLNAAAAKHNHPSYYIFENAVLPRKVVKPSDKSELGATRVTVTGLK
ncbi:SHD1 domain-containing protein [Blastopirellula marina]|uniref:SLA1 homology domain-containing protein n=1 Tax=Blastopirellula marina TaxID=124 RepID=A0A2S8G7I0_9BACT|nr:SHD1 domain-containing protein [Blastopirellula marina]PQO40104.1 hypothetical protein C5Y98_07295 [Blastopirellula marina]PTL45479.1 hypothetical protein C5Y97_07295 [Blastopirellula marina]